MPAPTPKPATKAKAPPGPPLSPRGRPTYETGIALGPTGSGKTSFAHEIADQYVAARGKVWAIDPSKAWRGVKGVTPLWTGLRGIDELLGGDDGDGHVVGLAAQPPGMVILDDADRYLRRPSQVRDDWMVSFRHYRKDLLIISRRPAGLPKDCFANATWIALFAGSLFDPHARNYVREAFQSQAKEVFKLVPVEPFQYLFCFRVGGLWSFEVKATKARVTTTASDKPR